SQVAALAAGVLDPADLVIPVVNGVAQEKEEMEQEKQRQEEEAARRKALAVKKKMESDEESSEEDEEEERAPAETVGVPEQPQSQQGSVEGMEVAEEEKGREESSSANEGKEKAKTAEGEAAVAAGGAASQPEGMEVDGDVEEEDEEASGDDSSSVESSDDDAPEPPRRNPNPHLPLTGPLSKCPVGDVSDGEDEDFMGSAVPMTKNEEFEPILPLGEVSMDGAEMKKVGVILSLVEAAGTIVVQGQSPPLDEGCVLASSIV
ncbi:unnamed protein product, partial [Hapterophycus canaliculatus]